MSVDFDPVRVRPNRRRIDPVVVGTIVVVIGLVAAVVKPWEDGARRLVHDRRPRRSSRSPTAAPSSLPVGLAQTARADARSPSPTWADLAPALSDHPAWGVAAVVLGSPTDVEAPSPNAYVELWSRSVLDDAGVENAYVARDQESIVALGVTVPRGEVPQDVRIWRVHDDGGLEWIDADPVVGRGVDGTVLLVQPGDDGAAFASWAGGHYRIDVLVAGGIHRIALQIPGRFGNVPPPDSWPAAPADLVRRQGRRSDGDAPGAVRDGGRRERRPVRDAGHARSTRTPSGVRHWAPSESHGQAVAAVHLPRATGLGVMFTENAVGPLGVDQAAGAGCADRYGAGDRRHLVDPRPDAVPRVHARRRRCLVAPASMRSAPAWTDLMGDHSATWPVELRPGVHAGGSGTAFGPATGG